MDHALLLALGLLACRASPDDPSPVELGRVAWQRDHEAAFASAQGSGKPVLLFFQEVPG
jgi:hypothetical protein